MPPAVTEEAPGSGPHLLWAMCPQSCALGAGGRCSDWPPRAARLWHVLINSGAAAQAPASPQGYRSVILPCPSRGRHGGWSLLDERMGSWAHGCQRQTASHKRPQICLQNPAAGSPCFPGGCCHSVGRIHLGSVLLPRSAVYEESTSTCCVCGVWVCLRHVPVPALRSGVACRALWVSPPWSSSAASALGGRPGVMGCVVVLLPGPPLLTVSLLVLHSAMC